MTGFALGYGTNGFANHRLDDALAVIADLGYTAVGLTLDHDHLDPFARDLPAQVDRVAARLTELNLRCVVETGARYLLDPRRKHHPTFLDDEPARRVDFLCRAVAIAADLGAECVSFWSGVRPDAVDPSVAWERLASGVAAVLDEAERRDVVLGFEPEPGMLVQHLEQALRLREDLGSPGRLGITLDVGHCVAVEPSDAAGCVRRAGALLVNVQLDDMRPGVHEHLEFGEGELDLARTLAALDEAGYEGVAAVELPRHSHAAPEVARRSIAALRAALPRPGDPPIDDGWLTDAERLIVTDPAAVHRLFPAAGRRAGRSPLRPETDPTGLVHGTVDDLARSRLLVALAAAVPPARLAAEITDLYRHGDGAERRGVLRGLAELRDAPAPVVAAGTELVHDALRTNDLRLVVAAMGPFGARHLDPPAWRDGVLKCLFCRVPLAAVAELDRRADAELARMAAGYAAELRAAGRDLPADLDRFLRSPPGEPT